MRKHLLSLFVCALSILALGAFSWAQCPEDPNDRGNCDSLIVTCLDCEQTPGTGPWQVRFPLLVTHDQTQPDDSIAGFVIPIGWTRTNPSAFCSLSAWWNDVFLFPYPDFLLERSIFRHLETSPGDTMFNRMMRLSERLNYSEWATLIVDVSTDSAWARMSLVATGTADQKWWEGDRTLLGTWTFVIEDTMTICMDTTFWPPTGQLLWSRGDAVTYTPRDNLPNCFTVGVPPAPDFTIEAAPDTQTIEPGQSTDYTLTLTSVAGFDSPCTLTVTDLPAGASAAFVPNPVIPTNTSAMTVTTTGATPEGTYPLTVTATEIVPPLSPVSMGDFSATGPVQVQHSTQVVLKVVAPEAIAVTAPNGGEEWCVGSSENITWTSSGIDTVKIEYSTNSGSNWVTEVEKTLAAPGTYSWTVPNAPSGQCLVRICDAEDGTPCDQSDAVFTIKAAPTAPSGCIASDDLCDSVQVCWTDNSTNETKFYIYRDAAMLDSVGANVTCYDDPTASPGTIYEYCVSAYNDCGESAQSCDNGTRKAAPDAPSSCVASDDLCDSVQVCWTDNSTNETKFYIYRDAAMLDSVGANVTCYDDPTASPGTIYEYCVTAYNDCGESAQSCDNGTRKAAPDAPSSCVASDDLCDSVQVCWTDNSTNETKFYVYRDAAMLDSVGANVTCYDDPTASPGTTYEYCVTAYNECGESGQSCDDGTREAAPDAPSDCIASDDLCDKVQFTWTDNSGNEDGFIVYREGSPVDTVAAGVTLYDDPTATPGVTYNYCVSAYNDCGESNQCCNNGTMVAEAITVTSPNGGENWTVGTSQNITWTSTCIDSVDIEYSTNNGSSWITEAEGVLAASGSHSWTIPDAPSTSCLVRICDAEDGSPCDQSDAVFTISAEVVEAVTVTAPNGDEVWCVGSAENITWTSNDIDAVKIEYSTNNGSNWTLEVASVPAAGGSYSWTVPDAPSTDCLVKICDAADSDPCDQSNAVFTILTSPADPTACAASDDLCDKVQFTWTDNSGDETGFYIYRDAAKLDSVGADVTTYDDATATPGQTYTYGVSAYNDCGESAQCSDDGTRQAPPAAPSACTASDDLCDRVNFCWTDNSGDETGFYIYRDAAKLDSVGVDATCYFDFTATPGMTYNYCVSAYNDCGESSQCCENGTVVAQALAVTSPNGGENWMVGTSQSITWTSDCISLVDIEYSTDGASSWTTEAQDVSAAAGTYSWTIPDAPSTNCLVRICDASDGSPCDQSNAVFTISTDVVEAVTVTAPNGGEVWCVGSAENITWTSSDIDAVKIEYSTDGGSTWTVEVASVPAAGGSYSWTVPDAPSENCLVRISDVDGDPSDQSNAVFTILGPPADPSACVASDDLCDKVQFTWTDNSGDETGFYIYRDAAKLDSVGADVTTYDDATATPGQTYTYGVSAYSDCGESAQCSDDGTRQAPPDAPTNCDASDISCDRVHFCWQDNSADEIGFYIYRDGAKLDSVGADLICYDDLSGTPGQTYSYGVSAYKDCGESAQCSDDGTRKAVPADPTGCLASDDNCDKVAFCWADLSDNEIGFYVYRDGVKIDSVGADATCYDDFTAAPGVTYEYCVTAYNECGESGRCCDNGSVDEESITVTSPDGGESWRVGSAEDIEWICSCIDSVMLEYSTDAGGSWTPIDSGIACGSETYSWTIPDTPSDDCLVRVSDDSDGVPADTSDFVFTIYRPGDMIYVDFDIKPGSCPNPFNTKSKGVLPVAILGTDEFEVRDIDPSTVMLEGVSPLRWNWNDVSRPVIDPTDTCDCTTRGGDGYTDMTFKFETQEIVDALETQMPFVDGETRILTITGMTYAGVPIEGTDCVVIIHKGRSRSSSGNIAGYNLGKNHPNPFNPETHISFTLPERAHASLTVYNVLGKAIKVLVDREMSAGSHTFRWDGRDEFGNPVSSGIYFYRLKADTFDQTMKMVLMK